MSFLFLFSSSSEAKIGDKIVLGFSQIGAESAWRIANTKSIKEAADAANIILIFSDAQQKQSNQIKAIKSFILQKVDVIAFSPVVAHGWRDVLLQAKKANIPVVLIDREIDEKDKDLYISFIGSDFLAEGKKAAQCLLDVVKKKGLTGKINIVELRGTEGSAPALLREKGFKEILKKFPQYSITRSEGADFKESLGKELMEKILKEESLKKRAVNVLYAHNDSMALGAIPSIEKHGLIPGKDILIVSVDAIKEAFVAMKSGKINCTVECSPLLGPQLISAVKDLMNGKPLSKRIITVEGVFHEEVAEKELPNRKY